MFFFLLNIRSWVCTLVNVMMAIVGMVVTMVVVMMAMMMHVCVIGNSLYASC